MSEYAIAAIVALLLVALLAAQLYRVVQGYRKAIGTPWQRFLAAFSDSLTILWARVVAFGSAGAAFFVNFAPALIPGGPIHDALVGVLQPQYVPWYGLAVAILIELARRRPGSIDPVTPPAQDKTV